SQFVGKFDPAKFFPALAAERPLESTVSFAVADVKLPFSRATITETDSTTIDAAGKAQTGTATTFDNTPQSWIEFTAGTAVIVGPISGSERLKVSGGKYASDSITRGLTVAAVAIHPVKYDSTN